MRTNCLTLFAGVLCALTLSIFPARAAAADLIKNGSLDTNMANWTWELVSGSGCDYYWYAGQIEMAGDSPVPSKCGVYQDVALPAGTTNSLTVRTGTVDGTAGAAGFGQLEIRNPATNAVLQILYTHDGAIVAHDPVATRGPFDLSAYAGQTVRVYFWGSQGGGGNLYTQRIDDVVLLSTPVAAVPTLTEWAMILFGLSLAGGAALAIQRRRLAV